MLIDESSRLISAAKWMPNLKSGRSIAPNETYRWPPVLNNELLKSSTPQTPQEWFDFAESHPKQISPFFRDLVAKAPPLPKEWTPTYAPEHGAYPLDLRLLNFQAFVRPTLGIALEQHFTRAEQTAGIESAKAQLLGQIDRVIATRELAIADVEEILEQGAAASNWQMVGELILAFGPSAKPGESRLQAMNYQGEFIEIELDPERTFVENSNRYFERAKKAKARQGFMEEKLGRLEQERLDALQFRDLILDAGDISRLDELQSIAKTRRWLSQAAVAQAKGDRPFEGHRIKETFGPGGVRILYGENAESNDYLTLRVAKPNDYWLHVRGSTSAHVVLVTENSPERIQREQLLFAAKIAVSHSGSKHAGFVSVDYTLKKYVRKPRGAAKGAAFYTNEKTLHVES
jgi:predicted ribosome quality control (RQC) complex YloA/Tae2 family protein